MELRGVQRFKHGVLLTGIWRDICPAVRMLGFSIKVVSLVIFLAVGGVLIHLPAVSPAWAHRSTDESCQGALNSLHLSENVAYQFFWLPKTGRVSFFSGPIPDAELKRLRTQIFSKIALQRIEIDPNTRKVTVVFARADLSAIQAVVANHPRIVGWTDLADLDNRVRAKKINRRLLRSLVAYPGGSTFRVLVTLPRPDAVSFAESLLLERLPRDPDQWPQNKKVTALKRVPPEEVGLNTPQGEDLWEIVITDINDRISHHLALLPGKPESVRAELLSID